LVTFEDLDWVNDKFTDRSPTPTGGEVSKRPTRTL